MFDAAPESWDQKPLGAVAEIILGQSPPSSAVNADGAGLPFIQGNAEFGRRSPSPVWFASDAPKTANAGDVLLSVRAPVGEVNVAEVPLYIGRGVAAIRPRMCDGDFLFYAVGGLRSAFSRLSQGSTFDAINGKELRHLYIPVPPLDEQRRIAEVLRSIDEAIEATEAVLGSAAAVRQSVLNALMSALVEADDGEHVLSDVAEVRTGLAKNKNASGGQIQLPYLRVANVQDGWFDLSDMHQITVEPDKVERYSLKNGDVLLTEGGDYDKLGRGGVWKAQVHPCLHQNHVFCVRSDQTRLIPEFLALVTQSYLGRSYFLSCAKRTTNLASINSSQVRALPIPLPDIERQSAVVSEIRCIDGMIEREEEKLKSFQRLRTSQGDDLLSGRVRVPA